MTSEINLTRSKQSYNFRMPRLGEDTCRLTAVWSSVELSNRDDADDKFSLRHNLELSEKNFAPSNRTEELVM